MSSTARCETSDEVVAAQCVVQALKKSKRKKRMKGHSSKDDYTEVHSFVEQLKTFDKMSNSSERSESTDANSLCSYSTIHSLNSSRHSAREVYAVIAENANKKSVCLKKMPRKVMKMVKVIAPLLWLQIRNGSSFNHALLDSGAAINMIDSKLLAQLPSQPLGQYAIHVKGVNNTSVKRQDWYMVALEFQNGEVIPIPFLVGTPEGIDMILGMPFIKQTRTVIDARTKMIYTDVGDYAFGDLTSEKTIKLPVGAYPSLADLTDEQILELDKVMETSILTPAASERIRRKMIEVQRIWTAAGYGQAKGVEFSFLMSDNHPICLPPRHIPQVWHQAVDDEMDKMIEDGVVEPSISPYCTYPVLAAKKDGGIRFAVDYRKLNNATIKDKTPLPRIEDLIAAVEGSKFFALFDLRGGFWHIPIHPAQKHLTAFRTHRGLYQFRVMPFGLVNAPATFQRWMECIFGDLRHSGVLVYIDDVLVHAKTEEEFVELVLEVLERLHKHCACLKLSKCEIAHQQFDYLGHLFEDGTRRPQTKKVDKLRHLAHPHDRKSLQSLLGMFNFYRLYIPNFSDVAKPLTRLLMKNVPFIWDEDCGKAVSYLVDQLSKAVLRVSPTGSKFRVETDASDVAVGAVLYDLEEFEKNDNPLPIMFMSKTLSRTEQNWSTAEREAYAIVWALETADPFLRGRQVQVMCDHKNLVWMMSKKTGKIARWCSRLTEYDVEIIYQQGDKNIVADFLSRYIEDDPFVKDTMFCYGLSAIGERPRKRKRFRDDDGEEPTVRQPIEVVNIYSSEDEEEDKDEIESPLMHQDVEIPLNDQSSDIMHNFLDEDINEPDLQEVIDGQEAELPQPLIRGLYKSENKWFYMNGLWVPPTFRTKVMDAVHLLPPLWHPRSQRMKRVIARLYNWPGLQRDVDNYVRSCLTCRRTHPGLGITEIEPYKHPVDDAFDTLYIDLWGPFVWKDDKHILLTMIDNHTKWAEIAILEQKTSTNIAQALFDRWFSRFGAPKVVVNDNENAVIGKAVKRLTHLLGIKGLQSTIYHPQGNAPIETFHRTLKTYLVNLRPNVESIMSVHEAVSWALMCYRSYHINLWMNLQLTLPMVRISISVLNVVSLMGGAARSHTRVVKQSLHLFVMSCYVVMLIVSSIIRSVARIYPS